MASETADKLDQALEVLRAYEQWEADVITSDEAWAPNGMASLPRIPQELWDRLVEIQGMRNKVLGVFQPATQREGA